MDHGQLWQRRAKPGNAAGAQRSNVERLQVRAAEGNARHPRRDTLSRGKEDLFVDLVLEESILKRADFGGVAFVEQNFQFAFRAKHEELVRVDHRTPEIAAAVEGDSIGPCPLAQA